MDKNTANYKIKANELNMQENKSTKNTLLTIIKIITTGVVITLIPTIINYHIQQKELEIKRLESEAYLEKFSSNVIAQDDLSKRRNLVQFIATIAHSEGSKEGWGQYLKIVKQLAKEQEKIDSSIAYRETKAEEALITFLDIKNNYEIVKKENSSDLETLENDLIDAELKIKKINQDLLSKRKKREILINKSKLSSTEVHLKSQSQNVARQMNSPVSSTKLNPKEKLDKEP